MDDVYAQIAERIIARQEAIIGPVAVEQAEQVPQLRIDWSHHEVSIIGNGVMAIDLLIGRYKDLFGQVSVEVCKEAAHSLVGRLAPDQMPHLLK
jgi:hypothetical protein